MPATRDRLVEAAWGRIRDGGKSEATSRAITAAAGANLGSITYHFGSKDALLAEAVGTAIETLIAPALEALQDEGADPVTRMLAAVSRLQQAYEQSRGDAAAYLEALVQSQRRPLLRERVSRTFAEVRAALAAQMVVYKQSGLLPAWVEPESMAGLLIAVAQGVVLESLVDAGGPSHAAMADQFANMLLASRDQ
jgi:AcrR family transcriptional regulator